MSILFISFAVYGTEEFIVKNIYFKGLQRVTCDLALINMTVHVGDKVNSKNIKNTVHRLFSTRNFDNVQVIRDKDSLIIKVKERPIIASISFSGNTKIKEKDLKKILDSQGVLVGSVLDRAVIFNIEKSIERFYYEIGKYGTTITENIRYLPNNFIDLKLIFNEKYSAKIKKINIIGNHAFTTEELVSNFQLKDKKTLLNMFNNCKYQKKVLEEDIDSLYRFYLDRGYAQFNVNSIQLNLTPDKKNVYITINITEGLQYKLLNITISGNINSLFSKIEKIVKIKPGNLYKVSQIIKIKDNIKNLLNNYGYAYPELLTHTEFDEASKTVKLNININTGKRFYLNHLRFEGNNITNDSVLRRESIQMESSWLNKNLIDRLKHRLNQLGYFETIDISIEPVHGYSDKVNVICKVKERNTGSINIGAGLGTESGVSFQCNIIQNNWLGTGNSLGFSSIKNGKHIYSEFSITDPYFTIDAISLSGRVFYSNFNEKDKSFLGYSSKNYGVETNMSIPINENNSLNLGLNYIHNNLINIKPQISIWKYLQNNSIYLKTLRSKENDRNLNFSVNDLFLNLGWSYNNIDRGYFPTSGSNINLSSRITLPGSDNSNYKIKFNFSHYIPINKQGNWIIMGRANFGFSDGFFRKKAPFYDNFYIGGSNAIRGFRANTIGPKAVYYDYKSDNINNSYIINSSSDAVGGNAVAIISAELIIPTTFFNEKYTNSVRTSFFIDAGTLWDTSWKNTLQTSMIGIPDYSDPSNIRLSYGISLQWASPLGPLIFSYAQPIKKYTNDQIEKFQFSVGKTW